MSLAKRLDLGLIAALGALLSGCSLLAPSDDYFAGGTKDAGVATGVQCGALPKPSGAVVNVNASSDLAGAVGAAAPGSTIVLAAGTYPLSASLRFARAGVSLRSASDDPASVVLDGQGTLDVAIRILASDVTLAHLTIQGVTQSGIYVSPDSQPSLTGTHLYGVRLIDAGQQYVRVFPSASGVYPDEGRIECSHLQMTSVGRTAACCMGCAPIGVDVIGGRGWTVRTTRFDDIYCDSGPLPFAALFSTGARDTVVENDTFIGCARALGLGVADSNMPRTYPDTPYPGLELDHIDGIVRNNVIYSNLPSFDTGIELNDTREPHVYHNTVVHGPGATRPPFSSIDHRYPDTSVVVRDNLAINLTTRDNASGTQTNNLEQTPLGDFVDPATGDFHLNASAVDAIDRGVPVGEAGLDIDGHPHDVGAAPDLGADEYDTSE